MTEDEKRIITNYRSLHKRQQAKIFAMLEDYGKRSRAFQRIVKKRKELKITISYLCAIADVHPTAYTISHNAHKYIPTWNALNRYAKALERIEKTIEEKEKKND